jgi:hypothetical protein
VWGENDTDNLDDDFVDMDGTGRVYKVELPTPGAARSETAHPHTHTQKIGVALPKGKGNGEGHRHILTHTLTGPCVTNTCSPRDSHIQRPYSTAHKTRPLLGPNKQSKATLVTRNTGQIHFFFFQHFPPPKVLNSRNAHASIPHTILGIMNTASYGAIVE